MPRISLLAKVAVIIIVDVCIVDVFTSTSMPTVTMEAFHFVLVSTLCFEINISLYLCAIANGAKLSPTSHFWVTIMTFNQSLLYYLAHGNLFDTVD